MLCGEGAYLSKGMLQLVGMGRQLGSGAESTAEMIDGVHILALVAQKPKELQTVM